MIKASASSRNRGPILEVLQKVIPKFMPAGQKLKCLEIASGPGQHVAHFAAHFPDIDWQPSDIDPSYLKSIQAYKDECHLENVRDPVYVDIVETVGEAKNSEFLRKAVPASYDLIYNCNMIHISPYACTEGLFRNAGILLRPGGLLITYGPYAFNGILTPESNVRFDEGLKSSNPEWGVRDVDSQLKPLAKKYDISLELIFDMPANNKTLIWRKQQ